MVQNDDPNPLLRALHDLDGGVLRHVVPSPGIGGRTSNLQYPALVVSASLFFARLFPISAGGATIPSRGRSVDYWQGPVDYYCTEASGS